MTLLLGLAADLQPALQGGCKGAREAGATEPEQEAP